MKGQPLPGNILLIDDITTSRIVLKVKLAAACYQVTQTATAAEGLRLARKNCPDLILCAPRLPDMDVVQLTRRLRAIEGLSNIPILVVAPASGCIDRMGALKAGVAEIIYKPIDDDMLFSRIRSLIRGRDLADELRQREGTRRALGFAEAQAPLTTPPEIALIADDPVRAMNWSKTLTPYLRGHLRPLSLKQANRMMANGFSPDAVAIWLGSGAQDGALRFLADRGLRARKTPCGILAVHEDAPSRAVVDSLDRGADDIMINGFEPEEAALRLLSLARIKRQSEHLRHAVRDGLRAAVTDPLTGLYNRRYAMPSLARIAKSSYTTGQSYAVMVIDLDHFKLVNDQLGHTAGDAVLEKMGNVLRGFVGPSDLAARIGGEEFLIAIPRISEADAQSRAHQLCDLIAATPFRIPGQDQPLSVTASIGLAMGEPVGAEGPDSGRQTTPAILERADKALYGAKTHGRNQVTIARRRPAA